MSLLRALFEGDVDQLFEDYASSLEQDMWIAEHDLDGSIAHVTMLGEVGVLEGETANVLADGLRRIREELLSDKWAPDASQEDIHMAVEARLTELVGDVGGMLHTARSRNDQVATDVRLWLKDHLAVLAGAVRELVLVLVERVERDGESLIPGYTHLQRGQPILLGHHLLAHAWALSRDRDRILGTISRTDLNPLGAGAMAGSPYPVDRNRTAELLGFSGVIENAMDAVAAKDHLQEAASTCAICMSHLSRMAEELVLWSSTEFALVQLADSHTTSSSIMPQKRNPDGAELIRGQVGVVYGHLQALLTLTKGLPLSYNRDLQQERRPLVESLVHTTASVRLMAAMWRDLEVRSDRFEGELYGDFCLATELADYLVARGVAFREAHHAVGKAVRWCEEQGGNLSLLDGGTAARFHELFPLHLDEWLDPRRAIERRVSHGGTAPAELERQVIRLRQLLGTRGDRMPSDR